MTFFGSMHGLKLAAALAAALALGACAKNPTDVGALDTRGGTQQIYIMGAGGGGANRISFGNGRYSTPVWSPKGDYIAFTKQSASKFAIGVMKPDGSGERILAEGFHNEGPTWAPNGLFVMFFRNGGGGPKLYMVDIFGRGEFPAPTPSYGSDPSWSPLLG